MRIERLSDTRIRVTLTTADLVGLDINIEQLRPDSKELHSFLFNIMETIKEDKKNHGLGGKIVKRIVKKYRGVVNYRVYGDSFEVMAAIPLAETVGRKTENVECGDLR